jgi:hypothetical protein
VNSSISFATLAGAYIGESLEDPNIFNFQFCLLLLTKAGKFAKAGESKN